MQIVAFLKALIVLVYFYSHHFLSRNRKGKFSAQTTAHLRGRTVTGRRYERNVRQSSAMHSRRLKRMDMRG